MVIDLRSLNHPNIVKYYGYGNDAEYKCIIMESAKGSLESLLETQKLGWDDKWRLVFHAAKAISFLHGREIVHGDLTVQNFLVCSQV